MRGSVLLRAAVDRLLSTGVYLEWVPTRPPIPALDPAPADGVVALRRWTAADAPQLAAACADPLIQRWTLVPDRYDEDDARAFVALTAARWEAGRRPSWRSSTPPTRRGCLDRSGWC